MKHSRWGRYDLWAAFIAAEVAGDWMKQGFLNVLTKI